MSKNNYINVAFIFLASLIAWFLNYAYHPIMLKYLTIEEFWVFWSLVWIFNILWIFITGLVLFLNKEISSNIENKSKIKYIFYKSFNILWISWIILYIFFILLSPLLSTFLKIEDSFLIVLVWLNIILSFLSASEDAVLRWIKKFHLLSFKFIIWPLIKLFLGFILVYFWYSIYWATIWFIVWWLFSLLIWLIYLFNFFKATKTIWTKKEFLKDLYLNKIEMINFFFVSLFFAIFMNIDLILVKNIFDENLAWIYSWISIIWKFLIFLLLSIETVYYWQIMEYKNQKIPYFLIRNSVLLIFVTIILVFIFNYIFWEFILWLLKEELKDYFNIYILLLVYYGLLAFISFFSKILIWLWKYYVNYILWILVFLLIFLVYLFWTKSIEYFTYSFLLIWFIWTLIISFIFYIEYRKNQRE